MEESNHPTHVPGGVLLFHMGIVVAKQVTEKTTVVFDVGIIDRCGESVRINAVAVWLVVLPVSWVVDQKSV